MAVEFNEGSSNITWGILGGLLVQIMFFGFMITSMVFETRIRRNRRVLRTTWPTSGTNTW
ncbi:hypothetical protein N7474_003572 [Penicillium riverlandense]|uniref:uncharacterized protein n=1 Tax=Penicillium riverlandense TaxID=1903569 RepID=UPI002547FCEC|nr:uncharacterized protein N7474_003572 [Penicillium riverlandense]KAJ5826434.1 hypothetical protein N7474_003572 [Penicillium riverlandense]